MSTEDQEYTTSIDSIEHASHLRVMLIVLVVVLILMVVGLFLWNHVITQDGQEKERNSPRTIENNEPEALRADTDTQILNTVSTSDTIDAIEADLKSTNLDNLDQELTEIGQELNRAQ